MSPMMVRDKAQKPTNSFSLRKCAILGNAGLALKPAQAAVLSSHNISPLFNDTAGPTGTNTASDSTSELTEPAWFLPSDTCWVPDSEVSEGTVPSSPANATSMTIFQQHTEAQKILHLFETHARRFQRYGYNDEEPWGERFLEVGRRVHEDLADEKKNRANEDLIYKSRLNRFQR